jgi:hypothetical protein|tara:strand:+ start:407 stop:601 length:195 start_codon:yes stop_codon:yes gene_type:complete
MNNFTPKYGLANFNAVKKNTIKKLLQLEQGRFPTKRINNFNDIIVFEKMHSLSNEAHFNCETCG